MAHWPLQQRMIERITCNVCFEILSMEHGLGNEMHHDRNQPMYLDYDDTVLFMSL